VGRSGKKNSLRRSQKARRYALYLSLLVALKISKLIPYSLSLDIGSSLGSLSFFLLRKQRRITIQNLKIAFGEEMDESSINKLAKEVFKEQGKNAFEMIKIEKLMSDGISKYVRIEGIENLEGALSMGKGVIFITAHLGNWELLAMSMAHLGYPSNPYIRKINNEYIDELLTEMRRKYGVKPIVRDGLQAIKKGLKVLKDNEILGILIDQDTTRVEGVFVDFFGRQAYTPSGAAALAITTGSPVIFGFITRQKDNKHVLKLSEPFFPQVSGEKKRDILHNTQIFTKEIEKAIRENPSQWVFMHRRWRHTPENLWD